MSSGAPSPGGNGPSPRPPPGSPGPPPRGPPPSGGMPSPRGIPPRGDLQSPSSVGPPRGLPPRGPPPRNMQPPSPRGPPPRAPPPSAAPSRGVPGASPRGPPPRAMSPSQSPSPIGSPPPGATPPGMSPRGPPPGRGPSQGAPTGPYPSPSSQPRGPPRGLPPGASPVGMSRGPPPGASPRGMPPSGSPLGFAPGASPRGVPPGVSPRGAPPGLSPRGGPAFGTPRGVPPGASPRGLPPRGAPRGMPPMMSPRGIPPRGMPPGSSPQGAPRPSPSAPPGLPRGVASPRGMPSPRGIPSPRGLPARPAGRPLNIAGQGPPAALPPPSFGKLTISIFEALDLVAGVGTFGKANPFLVISVGAATFKTKPHRGGGKNPVWNEESSFDISTEQEAKFEVYDKDENDSSEKFMGLANVSIVEWIATGNYQGEIDLMDKSWNVVGKLKLAAKFSRSDSALVPSGGQTGTSAGVDLVPANSQSNAVSTKANVSRDPNGPFSDQEIVEAFIAFDLDKNHFIGAAEIRHILINIGEQVTDDEIDEMIRMVDKDGDGQVSFDEFYSLISRGKTPPTGLNPFAPASIGEAQSSSSAMVPVGGQSVVAQRAAKKSALSDFARDNNIKPESVKKAYKRFQATDQDGSGLVDYTEFCEILQVDPTPQSEKCFQLFDHSTSGQIDIKEFLISLANFTGAGKDDKLKFAFLLFDEDGNGVITKGELSRILKANHMAKTEAEIQRKAETIMAQADKDGDGVITFDEFVIVSKKFPNILFPAHFSAPDAQ